MRSSPASFSLAALPKVFAAGFLFVLTFITGVCNAQSEQVSVYGFMHNRGSYGDTIGAGGIFRCVSYQSAQCFGIATEAYSVTGSTAPVVGAEFAVVSLDERNPAPKIIVDIVWKSALDWQPVTKANNRNSVALRLSARPGSEPETGIDVSQIPNAIVLRGMCGTVACGYKFGPDGLYLVKPL